MNNSLKLGIGAAIIGVGLLGYEWYVNNQQQGVSGGGGSSSTGQSNYPYVIAAPQPQATPQPTFNFPAPSQPIIPFYSQPSQSAPTSTLINTPSNPVTALQLGAFSFTNLSPTSSNPLYTATGGITNNGATSSIAGYSGVSAGIPIGFNVYNNAQGQPTSQLASGLYSPATLSSTALPHSTVSTTTVTTAQTITKTLLKGFKK